MMFISRSCRVRPEVRCLSAVLAFVFTFTSVMPFGFAAEVFEPAKNLPEPGEMVMTSDRFVPTIVRGLRIDTENPLRLNFIVDSGNAGLKGQDFKTEVSKLVKYFLATLTVPEDQIWVNLSPYEDDRIVPEALGVTPLGRDLLAQDYLLKQITASLMDPNGEQGKTFWRRIQEKSLAMYGTTDVPVDTFNKVWITPKKAEVYVKDNTIFVSDSSLQVLLEEDYKLLKSQEDGNASRQDTERAEEEAQPKEMLDITAKIVREIFIPELEKEVNNGKNFAPLRQIYNSMLLATWYKKNLREGLLGKTYVDQEKTAGINIEDEDSKFKIHDRYLEAFKRGAVNLIQEEYDPQQDAVVTRKYFSGGTDGYTEADVTETDNPDAVPAPEGDTASVAVDLEKPPATVNDIPNEAVKAYVEDMARDLGAGEIEVLDDEWDFQRLIDEALAIAREALEAEEDEDERVKLAMRLGMVETEDGNYATLSNDKDVARVVSRTFVASRDARDKGKGNNWRHSGEILDKFWEKAKSAYGGKKMYVIPYLMGPENSDFSQVGVQVTDSLYVAISMQVMATVGRPAWEALGKADKFVKAVHVTGPLDELDRSGEEGKDDRLFATVFDGDGIDGNPMIISYGSEYGGNALQGKKMHALRLAAHMGRDEGWLAEHMLILEITDKKTGKKKYGTAAYPSASGKTNMAMLVPPDALGERYEVKVVGDDIAWLRVGEDGTMRAINPEAGMFGVVPGSNEKTNPRFYEALNKGGALFTNVAFLMDPKTGKIVDQWWKDKTKKTPEPTFTTDDGRTLYWRDWQGNKIADRPEEEIDDQDDYPWAHPNSRAAVRSTKADNLAVEAFKDPEGVPISFVFWGGRVEQDGFEPLMRLMESPEHALLDGATMVVGKTAAEQGGNAVQLNEDLYAQRPFLAYHELEYMRLWLDFLERVAPEERPTFGHVNFFRKGIDGKYGENKDGKFVWPGFGENLRLAALAMAFNDGHFEGREAEFFERTPIGLVPKVAAFEELGLLAGLSDEDIVNMEKLLTFDEDIWRAEFERRQEFLENFENFGEGGHTVPEEFRRILAAQQAWGDPETAAGSPTVEDLLWRLRDNLTFGNDGEITFLGDELTEKTKAILQNETDDSVVERVRAVAGYLNATVHGFEQDGQPADFVSAARAVNARHAALAAVGAGEEGHAMRRSSEGLTAREHFVVNQAIGQKFDEEAHRAISEEEYGSLDPNGALGQAGVKIFAVEGLSEKINDLAKEAGLTENDEGNLLGDDLMTHPGSGRNSLYLDAEVLKEILAKPKSWREAWAAHELVHLKNPTMGEESVQAIAPLPSGREAPVGGIDLSDNLNVQLRRDSEGIVLPVSMQPLEQLDIRGFEPIIISVEAIDFEEALGRRAEVSSNL